MLNEIENLGKELLEISNQLKGLPCSVKFDYKDRTIYVFSNDDLQLFGWASFIGNSEYKYEWYKCY